MRRRLLFIALLLFCFYNTLAIAYFPRAPYSQRGWVVIDRWGGIYMCFRSYVMPVNKDLHSKFRLYRDKFVNVAVKKIQKSFFDPGPWRIDAIGKIAEPELLKKDVYPIKLRLNVSKKTNTEEVIFQVTVDKDSLYKGRIKLDDFRIVILRHKQANDEPKYSFMESYRIANGPSYVYSNKKLTYEVLRGPADSMRMTSEHAFKWFIVFRKQLPLGEYEAWLMYHNPEFGGDIGAKSELVAFSVISSESIESDGNRGNREIDDEKALARASDYMRAMPAWAE